MKDMYDPMTGKLLQQPEPSSDGAANEMNFDPMTGQPIKKEASNATGAWGFDPMTGQPVNNTDGVAAKTKKKTLPIIGCAVAGIVIVAAVIIGCIMNGTFLSKSNKVMLAAKNTFNDQPQFMKDLDLKHASSWLKSGKYQIDMKLAKGNSSAEGSYISTNSEKQLNAGIYMADEPSVEVQSSLTDSQLKVYVPELSPEVYVLNYKEDIDGCLADLLSDEGLKSDELSDALSQISDQDEQIKNTNELSKTLFKQVKDLKWEKTDKKEFKINGKSRKAAGYEVTITADDAEDFLDSIDDFLNDNYEDASDLYREPINEMYDVVRTMPDIDFTFYIYKNRLAAIYMETEYGEFELLFKGGDFRMQNMELEFSDRYSSVNMELRGKTADAKESYELSVEGETVLEMEYNKKSGKYEICLIDGGDDYIIDGEIIQGRDQTGISVETDDNFEIELVLTKSVTLEDLPDREVDIMDLKEEDWMDLLQIGNYL